MSLPLAPTERRAAVRRLVAIFGSVNDLIDLLDTDPLDPALARARATRDMIGELVVDLAGTAIRTSA
ncbi:hypothetical protein [Nocardia jiangxiensis]|uniref:Uncharacterized protein n=1 Tax=Nocardia jiangxiensis TaxID=282685 RepID=A0ABW6SGK2_9NOCA|nr:hypothetical protein [Nocardia jiangxiensis]